MNTATNVGQAVPDAPPAASPRAKKPGGVWAALFWKEWCEHRWKMLAMSVVGLSILLPLWWSMKEIEANGTSLCYLMIIAPLTALFLGMGMAAGEQASGTMEFARRLPTPTWRLALVKLVVAIATVFVPLSLALFVSSDHPFGLAPALLLMGTSLVLWFAVLGMNRPDEISAAAFGVGGVVLVWTLFGVGCYQLDLINKKYGIDAGEWSQQLKSVAPSALAALPGGIIMKAPGGPGDRTAWLWFLAAYATTHVPLAWRWLACYGARSPRSAAVASAASEQKAWLGAPLASPTVAILWKQLRETLPVALAALALAVAWSLAVTLTRDLGDGSMREHLAQSAGAFAALTGMCAFLAAVVAGVGLFVEDLRPGVHTFWRSRPIWPSHWFWLKYTTGLACLAAVFGSVMTIGLLVAYAMTEADINFNHDFDLTGFLVVTTQYVLGVWVVYSGAACATCLVRQPIYAAILGVGFPTVLYGLTATVMVKLRFSDATSVTTLSTVVALAAIAATLTAWQAIRRDWAILR